jgi:hypothetical protein
MKNALKTQNTVRRRAANDCHCKINIKHILNVPNETLMKNHTHTHTAHMF